VCHVNRGTTCAHTHTTNRAKADDTSVLEAEAYAAWLAGALYVEQEKWDVALQKLSRFVYVCVQHGCAFSCARGFGCRRLCVRHPLHDSATRAHGYIPGTDTHRHRHVHGTLTACAPRCGVVYNDMRHDAHVMCLVCFWSVSVSVSVFVSVPVSVSVSVSV